FAPEGFQKTEIDDIVRNSITFDRIKQLLDTAPAVNEADIAHIGRGFQPVSGVAILFDRAEYLKNAAPTEAQVADYFKTNSANFVTPEYRTAKFVRFPLPADLAKLEGKAKTDAQLKAATATENFATKAVEIGFDKAAQAAGLKVETTLPFDARGNIKPTPGIDTANAAATTPTQLLAPAVFALSKADPVSRIIESPTAESPNEFIVADLGDITKSRPMTLDEVRPQIVQGLTDEAAAAALEKGVEKTLTALRAALKSGKPFAEAAKGLKTKPFINVSLTDEKAPREEMGYAFATALLEQNEISGFRMQPEGGYVVWLEKRLPVDQKKFNEQRDQYVTSMLDQRRELLWRDWIAKAQQSAAIKFAENGRG
ncbi:MAG: peptidylprolyl isomerase, partial [Chthoniobacterales bacterium]